jgi:thioredoxin reductase (NADPH)
VKDSRAYGWETPEVSTIKHDWTKMVEAIQNHIGSLNWGYRVQLRDKKESINFKVELFLGVIVLHNQKGT